MKKQNKQICTVRRPAYTTRAFTLVELIVVITILAILGTIAFISLQWYSSQARDSKRLSDIQNIKKSLELFSLNTWKYPEPDLSVTISYWSQDLRYQWTIWEQVAVNLSRNLNEKPTDPLTENEYTYSRTYAWNEYELLSIYESDLISLTSPLFFAKATKSRQPSPTGGGARTSIVSSIFAANANYPKINGNYNGVYVKVGTYYIPTPSIINANVWWNVDLAVTSNFLESQIITWWDNNIANVWIEASTWWLTWMSVEIFTWILDTDIWEDDYNNKEELAQALIDAYSWTTLANVWVYKTIVETANEDLVSLVDSFVLNKDNFVNTTTNTTNTYSCTWTLPSQNVSTSNDSWLTVDTAWQNIASWDNCYYECTLWYTGVNCDVVPNPYESCIGQNTPTPFSATTTYPWCNTADIIVCSWNQTWYTISACNVWATTASTDWTVSRWEYFQWWRNKWFAYWDTTQQSTQIANASYDPNNDTYWFVWNSNLSSYRYDWIVDQDDNLWWNNSWAWTDEQRQWPCPTWYHVPSQPEWSGIVTAWQWWSNWANMQTALKLPYAGFRHRNNGALINGGSYGYYWSSSPNGTNGHYLYFYSSKITPSHFNSRVYGFFVRCFKN